MIILYDLVDVTEVIRIKAATLYAKVSFDRFSKELHFVCICLGDFVVMVQCWIIAPTLWLDRILDFMLRLTLVGL